MGMFTDGNDKEDELFEVFMLNSIHDGSSKGGNSNHAGGCLTSFLIIITVPI